MAFKIVQMPEAAAPTANTPKFKIVQMPQSQPTVDANTPWTEVGQQALVNTPGSAYQFGADLVNAVTHPVQTVQAVGDLGAGALREGARYALPTSWFNAIDSVGNQDAANRASDTAGAVKDFYVNRYGSMDGFKQAVAQDPVGVLGDAATVLTGGEGAAVRVLGPASKTAKTLKVAAAVTNPLSVPQAAIRVGDMVAGPVAKGILGLTTGTSYGTIDEAYRAARRGGAAKKAFTDNLREKVPQADVIGDAKAALANMGDQTDAEYRAKMAPIRANATQIPFQPIEQAFQGVVDSMYRGGHQIVADSTIAKVKDIGEVVNEWANDPAMHTADGLDGLKRRIDDMMPSFSELNGAKNRERAVTATRNAVKDTIIQTVPEYADAMKGYETAKIAQKEIEQALGLGRNVAADTALRRIQSVSRNNANTNYGSRAEAARKLEQAGAPNLLPQLSGQALNTVLPRGILKAMLGGGAIAGAGMGMLSPSLLAALPFASPRLVGELVNATGSTRRLLSPATRRAKLLGLLGRLPGSAGLLGE